MQRRYKRLTSVQDVCRLLSKTVNEVRTGEIEESKAAKIGYLCNILIGALRDATLEARISAIEKELEHGKFRKSA